MNRKQQENTTNKTPTINNNRNGLPEFLSKEDFLIKTIKYHYVKNKKKGGGFRKKKEIIIHDLDKEIFCCPDPESYPPQQLYGIPSSRSGTPPSTPAAVKKYVITSPEGAGKTHYVLNRLREEKRNVIYISHTKANAKEKYEMMKISSPGRPKDPYEYYHIRSDKEIMDECIPSVTQILDGVEQEFYDPIRNNNKGGEGGLDSRKILPFVLFFSTKKGHEQPVVENTTNTVTHTAHASPKSRRRSSSGVKRVYTTLEDYEKWINQTFYYNRRNIYTLFKKAFISKNRDYYLFYRILPDFDPTTTLTQHHHNQELGMETEGEELLTTAEMLMENVEKAKKQKKEWDIAVREAHMQQQQESDEEGNDDDGQQYKESSNNTSMVESRRMISEVTDDEGLRYKSKFLKICKEIDLPTFLKELVQKYPRDPQRINDELKQELYQYLYKNNMDPIVYYEYPSPTPYPSIIGADECVSFITEGMRCLYIPRESTTRVWELVKERNRDIEAITTSDPWNPKFVFIQDKSYQEYLMDLLDYEEPYPPHQWVCVKDELSFYEFHFMNKNEWKELLCILNKYNREGRTVECLNAGEINFLRKFNMLDQLPTPPPPSSPPPPPHKDKGGVTAATPLPFDYCEVKLRLFNVGRNRDLYQVKGELCIPPSLMLFKNVIVLTTEHSIAKTLELLDFQWVKLREDQRFLCDNVQIYICRTTDAVRPVTSNEEARKAMEEAINHKRYKVYGKSNGGDDNSTPEMKKEEDPTQYFCIGTKAFHPHVSLEACKGANYHHSLGRKEVDIVKCPDSPQHNLRALVIYRYLWERWRRKRELLHQQDPRRYPEPPPPLMDEDIEHFLNTKTVDDMNQVLGRFCGMRSINTTTDGDGDKNIIHKRKINLILHENDTRILRLLDQLRYLPEKIPNTVMDIDIMGTTTVMLSAVVENLQRKVEEEKRKMKVKKPSATTKQPLPEPATIRMMEKQNIVGKETFF